MRQEIGDGGPEDEYDSEIVPPPDALPWQVAIAQRSGVSPRPSMSDIPVPNISSVHSTILWRQPILLL